MSWCVKQRGPVFTSAFTPLLQMFVAVLDFSILQEEIYLGRLDLVIIILFSFSFFIFFFFLHCFAPDPSLHAMSSVAGSVLVISGSYILLWGKSKEEEQNGKKDTQEDEDCMNNFEANPNVASKLRLNGEQGLSELQVKQLANTVTRS